MNYNGNIAPRTDLALYCFKLQTDGKSKRQKHALGLINLLYLCSSLFPLLLALFRPFDLTLRIRKLLSVSIQMFSQCYARQLTMYRRKSSSLSFWKRFMSFSTLALASLTSFSETTWACSS